MSKDFFIYLCADWFYGKVGVSYYNFKLYGVHKIGTKAEGK